MFSPEFFLSSCLENVQKCPLLYPIKFQNFIYHTFIQQWNGFCPWESLAKLVLIFEIAMNKKKYLTLEIYYFMENDNQNQSITVSSLILQGCTS